MKELAIYGAGGFGREIACLVAKINKQNPTWKLIGFFDDGLKIGTKNEYGPVLGGLNELLMYEKEIHIAMAIGTPRIVERLTTKIKENLNVHFPNLISPDVIFLDQNNYQIGVGNIITVGCLISCNVTIGDFNIFNVFVTVGHDVIIGNCNAFMPSVKISGESKIGNRNFFGVSSSILQQLKVGNDTVVGANSLIYKNTVDGNTYVGVPAKRI